MLIRCGNHPKADDVRHASVEAVRDCYYTRYMEEQEMLAEQEAERRNERYWEERGAQPCVCHTMALDGSGCLCGAS